MLKYLLLILLAFLVAILQVSFLPNLHLFGGIVNLPIIVLCYTFYLSDSSRKQTKVILLATILGLVVDLLSSGFFLSATLGLLALTLILGNLQKLILFDGSNPLTLIPVFFGTILFDIIYLVLNRVFSWNLSLLLPILFDAVLTSLVFLVVLVVAQRFRRRQHHEIKIS